MTKSEPQRTSIAAYDGARVALCLEGMANAYDRGTLAIVKNVGPTGAGGRVAIKFHFGTVRLPGELVTRPGEPDRYTTVTLPELPWAEDADSGRLEMLSAAFVILAEAPAESAKPSSPTPHEDWNWE